MKIFLDQYESELFAYILTIIRLESFILVIRFQARIIISFNSQFVTKRIYGLNPVSLTSGEIICKVFNIQ